MDNNGEMKPITVILLVIAIYASIFLIFFLIYKVIGIYRRRKINKLEAEVRKYQALIEHNNKQIQANNERMKVIQRTQELKN